MEEWWLLIIPVIYLLPLFNGHRIQKWTIKNRVFRRTRKREGVEPSKHDPDDYLKPRSTQQPLLTNLCQKRTPVGRHSQLAVQRPFKLQKGNQSPVYRGVRLGWGGSQEGVISTAH